MTEKEAFVLGFIHRCVADGLNAEQISAQVKKAEDVLSAALNHAEKRAGILGDVAGAVGNVATTALPLAIAAPPILGGLGGYALARATDIDDTDVEDVKSRELIDTYKVEAEKLRRAKQQRAAKQQQMSRVRGYYG